MGREMKPHGNNLAIFMGGAPRKHPRGVDGLPHDTGSPDLSLGPCGPLSEPSGPAPSSQPLVHKFHSWEYTMSRRGQALPRPSSSFLPVVNTSLALPSDLLPFSFS